MDVTLNPAAHKISSLYTAHFAEPKEKTDRNAPLPGGDQAVFSQEGLEAASNSFDALAEKISARLSAMTKEDFMEQVRQWESENQTKLEVDPYHKVDPDGSIARKTYFESYLGQLKDMEDTIKNYYADAYKEAVSAPINSLTFISGKYLCTWSDYFEPGIPAKERQWAHSQFWAMLTDSHVALNDPYALAASGGPKTAEQLNEIAQKAVKDKLDVLLKEQYGGI